MSTKKLLGPDLVTNFLGGRVKRRKRKAKKRKPPKDGPVRCESRRTTFRNGKRFEVRCRNMTTMPATFCHWCEQARERADRISRLKEAFGEFFDTGDLESRIEELECRFG